MTVKAGRPFWKEPLEGQKLVRYLPKIIGQDMILFDTETSGLNPATDKIIQISAIKVRVEDEMTFTEKERIDKYINLGSPLPRKIIQITGITDEFLNEHGRDEDEVWPEICAFFGHKAIVVGHNVPFDISMLKALYARHNNEFKCFSFDTLSMARELYRKADVPGSGEVKNHKLGTLAEFLGADEGLTFHNSMDDITATMRIFRIFIDEYKERFQMKQEEKATTKVVSAWSYTGFKGMQRLYVKLALEGRVVYLNQRRPYEWGEKTKGSLALIDMKDVENQVLKLYNCETLEELSKVRESKWTA